MANVFRLIARSRLAYPYSVKPLAQYPVRSQGGKLPAPDENCKIETPGGHRIGQRRLLNSDRSNQDLDEIEFFREMDEPLGDGSVESVSEHEHEHDYDDDDYEYENEDQDAHANSEGTSGFITPNPDGFSRGPQ